jgi:peptidoglycan/LPS O-acetylase OafA/YrhL
VRPSRARHSTVDPAFARGNRAVPLLGDRPGITGLRALAAGLVVLHHAGALLPGSGQHGVLRIPGGWIGVDLFFVLSGFLITTGLLERYDRTRTVGLRDFYARRAVRLFPALATVVASLAVYRLVTGGETLRRVATSVATVATYTTNYYKNGERDVVPGLGHLWTLAIEEQFYLVWPLVLLVLLGRRVGRRTLLVGLGLLILAVVVNRAIQAAQHGYAAGFYRTDTHVDGMLWGIALSVAWRSGWLDPRRFRVAAAWALGVLGAYALSEPQAWSVPAVQTLLPPLTAVVVLGLLETDWSLGRLFSHRVIVYLGRRSYAIYLWHIPVLLVVQLHPFAAPGRQALLVVGGTLLMAEVSWRLVEEPARLCHRAFRRPADAGALLPGPRRLLPSHRALDAVRP